jgi:hypothetical protein
LKCKAKASFGQHTSKRGLARFEETPAAGSISDSPAVRSAYKEQEALPVASDEKGALSIARRRKG